MSPNPLSPRNSACLKSSQQTTSPNSPKTSPTLPTKATRYGNVENQTSLDIPDTSQDCDIINNYNTRVNTSCPEISFCGRSNKSAGKPDLDCFADTKRLQDSTVSSAVDPAHFSSHSRTQSDVERLRHCSDFTNPRDISFQSLDNTRSSVFKSQTAIGDGQCARNQWHDNKLVSPIHEDISLKSRLSSTLSESVLDNIGNESVYDKIPKIQVTDAQNTSPRQESVQSTSKTNPRFRPGQDMQQCLSTTLSASFIQDLGDQTIRSENVSMLEVDHTLQDISQSLLNDQETKLNMKKTLDSVESIIR